LQRRLAGCHRHSRVSAKGGRAEFSFPRDDGPFGWLDIARGGGAPEQQLQKALAMVKRGLPAKAKRQAYCGVLGARYSCVSFEPGRTSGHKFYRRYGCKNRYCLTCGPAGFRALFAKYVGLREVAAQLVPHWPCRGRRPERVLAKIDFTTKKLGRMPGSDEVRQFNRAVKRFFRLVEKRFCIGREAYGALWCDEFGGHNSNLHAHAMYAGPWLSNQGTHRNELAELWSTACRRTAFAGSFIVSIKPAKSFEAGLAHALKYAGKFLSHDPERLADLEQAFHGVRRVHCVAGFYNALPRKDSAKETEDGFSCPHCGAVLVRVGPMGLIGLLESQGYADLEAAVREAGKAKAFGHARASP
jgi:hypothetical protein